MMFIKIKLVMVYKK